MDGQPGRNGYTLYFNSLQSFGRVDPIEIWRGTELLFAEKKVGAGIGFYLGKDVYHTLFNKTGDQYCVYGDVFGTGSYHNIIGPFDL